MTTKTIYLVDTQEQHLTDYFLKIFNINRRGLVMDIEELAKNQNSDDWKNSKMPKPQSWEIG